MFVITVLFSLHAEHSEAFLEAVLSNARTSLAYEPGCWQFDVCVASSNPNDIFLYEVYDNKEAFDVHLASAHFLAFNALTSKWVTNKVVTAFDRTFVNLQNN